MINYNLFYFFLHVSHLYIFLQSNSKLISPSGHFNTRVLVEKRSLFFQCPNLSSTFNFEPLLKYFSCRNRKKRRGFGLIIFATLASQPTYRVVWTERARGKNSRENESKVKEASVQINSFSLLKSDLLWSQVIGWQNKSFGSFGK